MGINRYWKSLNAMTKGIKTLTRVSSLSTHYNTLSLSLSLDISLFYSLFSILCLIPLQYYLSSKPSSFSHIQFYTYARTHVRISRLKIWAIKTIGQFCDNCFEHAAVDDYFVLRLHEQFPIFTLSRCQNVLFSLRYSSFRYSFIPRHRARRVSKKSRVSSTVITFASRNSQFAISRPALIKCLSLSRARARVCVRECRNGYLVYSPRLRWISFITVQRREKEKEKRLHDRSSNRLARFHGDFDLRNEESGLAPSSPCELFGSRPK